MKNHGGHRTRPYLELAITGALHLPIMYAVMFTMVWTWNEVFHNLNTFYMAGMMALPMVLIMPLLMSSMYPNKKLNLFVYVGSVAVFLILFWFMREQTFIGDRQFVRSMIPHHSGAILMCEKAKLADSELKTLCGQIIKAQQEEIDQMKRILERL